MPMTHPKNLLRGGAAIRPIQRFRDWSDMMGTVALRERLKARRPMPSAPEGPKVAVKNLEGVKAGRELGGAYDHSNASSRLR